MTTTIGGGVKREVIKVTPSMTLAQVRDQFVLKHHLPGAPDAYSLSPKAASGGSVLRHAEVDLSLPWRLLNLAPGQSFDLVRAVSPSPSSSPSAASCSVVNEKSRTISVAIQRVEGGRIEKKVQDTDALWDVISCVLQTTAKEEEEEAEKKKKKKDDVNYREPVVVVMNRQVAGEVELRKSSLRQLGVREGPVLIRVNLRQTDKTVSEAEALIQKELDLWKQQQEQQQQQQQQQAAILQQQQKKQQEQQQTPSAATTTTTTQEQDEERTKKEREKWVAEEFAKFEAQKKEEEERRLREKEVEAMRLLKEEEERETKAKETEAVRLSKEEEEAKKAKIEQALLSKWKLDNQSLKETQQQLELQAAVKSALASINQQQQQQQQPMQVEEKQSAAVAPEPMEVQLQEPDIPETEKDILVFPPSNTSSTHVDFDVPDSFYDLTVEDLQMIRETEKRQHAEQAVLMTKSMREKIKEKQWQKFKRCMIRVRFPDRMEIQRNFHPRAHVSSIFQFVRDCLRNPQGSEFEFSLYTTPPVSYLSEAKESDKGDMTLLKRDLVPAALIHLKWNKPELVTSPYLKEELLTKAAPAATSTSSPAPMVLSGNATGGASGKPQPASGVFATGSGVILCNSCVKNRAEFHCVECDAGYCRACWDDVHSSDSLLSNHHKGTTTAAGSTTTRAPASSSSPSSASSSRVVPKWFKKL